MNRCALVRFCALSLLVCATGLAHAQRQFPEKALRGTLEVQRFPNIRLNGEPDRLSPGARIRNQKNQIVTPNSVAGKPLVVNYLREHGGLVHEVWILTASEAEQKRAHEGTVRNFRFASESGGASQ